MATDMVTLNIISLALSSTSVGVSIAILRTLMKRAQIDIINNANEIKSVKDEVSIIKQEIAAIQATQKKVDMAIEKSEAFLSNLSTTITQIMVSIGIIENKIDNFKNKN